MQKKHLTGLLAIVCAIGLYKVGARAWMETWGSFHSDVAIYMTVARGVVHGLVPYVDLFENKAPGVFLLGALSIKLFDGPQLLSWLQGFTILAFPFAVALPLLRRVGPLLLLAVFAGGCALALYVGAEAGQLLPESYGALLAVAFLAFAYALEPSRMRTALLIVTLLLSVGIKEPFAVSIVGGTLLLLPPRSAAGVLARSFLGAGIIGVAALLLLGWASAYVTVHLAHMLGFHVFHPWGTVGEPWWLRFHDLPRIWENLASFSPFLPWLIAVLWLGALAVLWSEAAPGAERRAAVARWALGTWLNTFTVGLTGDFYSHHFVFAIPLYVACLWICARGVARYADRTRSVAAIAATALAAAVLVAAPWSYRGIYDEWVRWAAPRQKAAAALDDAMARCGYERYFLLIDRPEGFYGFPRHLPYGPIFTQYGRFIGALPGYVDAFAEAMTTAPVMVVKTKEEAVPLDPRTLDQLESIYTDKPPACAGAFEQPLPYRIVFRR